MTSKFTIAILLLLTFCFSVPSFAQATCQNDPAISLPQLIVGPDSTEHATKSHWASTGAAVPDSKGDPIPDQSSRAITGQCGYEHGTNPNCTTKCSVNLTGGTTHSELGMLSAAGSHEVNHGWQNGTGTGSGKEASCTGYFGAGAANCFKVSGTCLPSITVTASGVSMSTGGSKVWTSNPNGGALSCVAKPDPQNQPPGSGGGDSCFRPPHLNEECPPEGCPCEDPTVSPIIVDTEGEGFQLTSATDGVLFDIAASGHPVQLAWTAAGSHNAFLVLDRNGDGIINNGTELFGNFTVQDASQHRNGFLALAEFDEPDQGGNGDGVIDERDAVYSKLRLWIDENHDGISQPNELHKLAEFGIHSLSLGYFDSRKTDQFGNQFRYKARVNPGKHRDPRDQTESGEPGRWAYDVFFVVK